MSASKRKPGKNRIVRNPREWIEKRTLLDQSQKRDIGIPCRLSIEAMKTGHGNMGESWGILAGSIESALRSVKRRVESEVAL